MDRHRAEAIVNACHDAWSTRDLDRMFRHFHPEIVYTCNVETPGASPVRYIGKDAMRSFLAPALEVLESVSVVEGFQYNGQNARTTIACYLKHFRTGIVLSGQYRQVYRFRDELIDQLEEFHDAAKMATFWRLVQHTEAMQLQAQR
jgi:ketosteroid isomerase-like protein